MCKRITDNTSITHLIFIFLFYAVAVLSYPATVYAEVSPAQQRQQLETLKNKVKTLRQNLLTAKTQKNQQRRALRKVETAISQQLNALRKLNKNIRLQQQKLAGLKSEQRRLTGSLATQKKVLAGQLRAAYAMGRQEYMKMLMNQEDPALFGRTMRYYDYFNKARTEQMAVLRHTLQELASVEQKVIEENQQLLALRQSQQLAKDGLEQDRRQREKVLAGLVREINSKQTSLQNVLGDIKQLETLLQGLQQALEDIPIASKQHVKFGKLRGKLSLPVKGRIIARYGSRRKQGKLRWQGVMISAREGTPVRAVSHGRVAFADWLRGFGLLVIIDHGDGYMSLYGHNQSINMETGDWVQPGEIIATVGSSGGRQKSGLYFEIRKAGRPTNPLRWCRVAGN